jgi:KaiC/GvpD/RAD55 family RecA-like ATPase
MHDGKIISIMGKRGTGKTTLAHYFFLSSHRLAFYISIFKPILQDDFNVYYSIFDFLSDNNTKSKNYFICYNEIEFNYLVKGLLKMKNILIIIDEISLYVNHHKLNKYIEYLVRFTREQGIYVVFITHRPQSFNPLILSLTDLFIFFNLSNVRDIEYLKKSNIDEIIIEKLPKLEQFKFLMQGDINILYNI